MKIIPVSIVVHREARHQSTCFCWAIKPRNGPWEGYLSGDKSLSLPAYQSLPGDDGSVAAIPALRYLCAHGVKPTAIPTRLNLSKQAGDVSVLAFDSDRLENGYYHGAEFEAFEINYRGDWGDRDVLLSGELGAAKIGRLTATIGLVPWHDKSNRPAGRTCGVLCDVGRVPELPDEEFATHRCAGAWAPNGAPVPNDGVKKADWTVGAVVIAALDSMRFRVQLETVTVSGLAPFSGFSGRLEGGKVAFTGGANVGYSRSIKWASAPGANQADIELHLPISPAPVVNDALEVTAGCRKTASDCKFYGNFSGANPANPRGGNGYNFQGFHQTPGSDGALRKYTG